MFGTVNREMMPGFSVIHWKFAKKYYDLWKTNAELENAFGF